MSENPCKHRGETQAEIMRCTSSCTNPGENHHDTGKIDTIKATLAGLSRDELLSLLADTLAGKVDSGEGVKL